MRTQEPASAGGPAVVEAGRLPWARPEQAQAASRLAECQRWWAATDRARTTTYDQPWPWSVDDWEASSLAISQEARADLATVSRQRCNAVRMKRKREGVVDVAYGATAILRAEAWQEQPF
jgi:hypothetical protein